MDMGMLDIQVSCKMALYIGSPMYMPGYFGAVRPYILFKEMYKSFRSKKTILRKNLSVDETLKEKLTLYF